MALTSQPWQRWDSVDFANRQLLPEYSGIYVVADADGIVWYVGQAINIKSRWSGKGHHRYRQLAYHHIKKQRKIYWLPVESSLLDEQERRFIELFKPSLNGSRVRKSMPKNPKVLSEIKRILKTLNRSNFLYPQIRSLVFGGYEEEDLQCIIVIINMNDLKIIDGSAFKKYQPAIRSAWKNLETECGRSEEEFHLVRIPCFFIENLCFEFVAVPEVIQFLYENPDLHDVYLGTTQIFGIDVKAIKNLGLFDQINLKEEIIHPFLSGKGRLTNAAYLMYQKDEIGLMASN
ncbi:MAG: GIY-YIG nuclease family protein [Cyanobacteria bacterium]|nr:GIY-YIG nuclease family protein [Cyanobacteriota bacterium]